MSDRCNLIGCDSPGTDFMLSFKRPEYLTIPEYTSTLQEIAKQMRINADIIMQEVTAHCDREIERLRRECERIIDG